MKIPLTENVAARNLPVYQRLASDSLLNRCVSGKTQNANEALHHLLWSKCPKTVFVSKNTLLMAISIVICEYNTGHLKTVADVQTASGLSPGTNTARIAGQLDKRRLNLAEKRKSTKYEVFRKKKKLALLKEEEKRQEKEGLSYGPGEF